MNTFIMESSVVRPATNPYGRLERNSVVGYEGEHNARALVVETTDDLSAYASVSLIIDDLDCGAMTKTTSGSKTVLSLTLTSAMIGASGRKLCQLLMVDSNNTVIAKSSQFVILIKRSNDIERSVEDGVSFIIISEAVTEMAQEAASAAAEEAAADVVAECQTIANTAAGSASAAAQSAAAAQAAAESIVVDSTLDTASTNAIQNKVVASELATIKADLDALAATTKSLTFVNGRYITTNVEAGELVDVENTTSSSNFCYTVEKCAKGDMIVLTGTGGNNPRLWAFVDNDYRLHSKSDVSARADELKLTVPIDGYYIQNSTLSSTHSAVHVSYFKDIAGAFDELSDSIKGVETAVETAESKYITITDPKQLRWIFGYFSSSGNFTANNSGYSMDRAIRVHSGYIRPDQSGLVQMQSRVIVNGTPTYKSWITPGGIEVNEDCSLRVSVRYADTSVKCNAATILDHVEVNLMIDKTTFYPADYKARNVTFNFVPPVDYVGKHIDSTGFGQSTSYADSLALWRALPAQSDGYITETEIGEVSGYKMYKYSINPAYQGRSGAILPHVFIVTSLHGHEKSVTYGLYYLIKDMLEHYADSPVLTFLRNYVRFTIIPMANPYGWDTNNRQNENGVNLNRNFDTSAWSKFDSNPEYATPGEYNYRGTAPFSEIETQLIRTAYIAEEETITLVIDGHTNGINTHTPEEITTPSINSVNTSIEAIKASAIGIDEYLSGIKGHMDSLYGTSLGNIVYGSLMARDAETELKTQLVDWGHESAARVSCTLEVLCGTNPNSDYAGYLGSNLYRYSPDVIKLCGEMIGNFICKILYMLNKTQL